MDGRSLACGVLASCLLAGTAPAALAAGTAGPAITVSGGSPFTGCTSDDVAGQPGTAFIGSEIEPKIDVNPLDPRGLIAGWQQDRWSSGGSRGLVAGYSKDGGETWRTSIPQGATLCTGGRYQRSTDPWVSFGANGLA